MKMIMKNISYILCGILALALIVVYIMLKQDINNLSDESADNSGKRSGKRNVIELKDTGPLDLSDVQSLTDEGSFPSSDIVYVNTDSLVLAYDLYKETVAPLDQKLNALDQDYNRQVKAIEDEYNNEMQSYNQGLKTTKAMEETAMRLGKKKEDLDRTFQQQAESLSTQYSTAMAQVEADIRDYITVMANLQGYRFILNGTALLHTDQSNNITKEIVEGLNRQHAASK